ncbi:YT521-B-like domain-containing protein [Mycena crocata]|nr:YT521-B-like domain-containing protein [Mycena crocata]
MAEPPPYESTLTPKQSFRELANEDRIDHTSGSLSVYAFTPTPGETEQSLNTPSGGGDFYMSGHGRGGSEQARSTRRQGSQASQGSQGSQSSQRRQVVPGYPSLNVPPESPRATIPPFMPPPMSSFHPSVQAIRPPHNMAHSPSPPFAYAPAYHVPEQPQSIHAVYPTIAGYSQYPPDTAQQASPQQPSPGYAAPFRYQAPMSPGYPQYQQQPSFSPPPAMYPPQHVYPGSSYPQFAHHSPSAQEPDGGTWYYVPSQQQQQQQQQQPQQRYDAGPSTYFYSTPSPPQPPPTQQHQDEYGSNPTSPTYAHPSTAGSSAAPSPIVSGGRDSRPIQRRSYHPNPPAHRSEWVMWAGNVPGDAIHDELWRFFTSPPDGGGSSASSSSSGSGSEGSAGRSGVVSIFLISRSSCAFVNYETEAHLLTAIERFNGVPLRPDPRCARLVCRVRRKDDDLRAGVGGQRGIGLHRGWVKAKEKEKLKAADDSASVSSTSDTGTSSSDAAHSLAQSVSALSLGSSSGDEHRTRPAPRPQAGSNSSGSLASTNSSLLQQHFPQRFFILKSLTRDDLELSVQSGLWATQRHNEGILDRAFRTSKDVFLIFSVNKSGEFYGYARMAGRIGQAAGGRVTWAARSPDGGSPTAARTPGAATAATAPVPAGHHDPQETTITRPLLSVERLVENSPAPFPTPNSTPMRPSDVQSAPAELGEARRAMTSSPAAKYSLDHHLRQPQRSEMIDLDESAPLRAMRSGAPAADVAAAAALAHERTSSVGSASGLGAVAEEESGPGEGDDGGKERERADGSPGTREEGWGQDFRLDWLCTERLPFQRTRHIRNPWNHDREVKVSRDGTELEPTVGKALLAEWQLYLTAEVEGVQVATPMSEGGPSSRPGPSSSRAGAGGGGGGTSRS